MHCAKVYNNIYFQVYKGDLQLEQGGINVHVRPSLEVVIKTFRPAKLTAIVAAIAFSILFVVIWPGSMLRYSFELIKTKYIIKTEMILWLKIPFQIFYSCNISIIIVTIIIISIIIIIFIIIILL